MKEQTGYETDDPVAISEPASDSFTESDGHSLNGLKLQPYTIDRMWAADAMGLRYGRLSKAAGEQFATDNTYPGMAGDVAIVVWLCTLIDPEEIRAARRDPGPAEEHAIKFAKEHRMASPKQKGFWDAYVVFMKIMHEVHSAYGEPEVEKKTDTTTE